MSAAAKAIIAELYTKMSETETNLSSALKLLKQFIDDWLREGMRSDYNDLKAFVGALKLLKREAEQKLLEQTRNQVVETQPSPGRGSTVTLYQQAEQSSAQQEPRRSERLRNNHRDKSPTLFVPSNSTHSDNEDDLMPDVDQEAPFSIRPSLSPIDIRPNSVRRATSVEERDTTFPTLIPPTDLDGETNDINISSYFEDAFLAGQPLMAGERDVITPIFDATRFSEEPYERMPILDDSTRLGQMFMGMAPDDWDKEQGVITSTTDATNFNLTLDSNARLDEPRPSQTRNFATDAPFKRYLDIAYRSGFRLPHENSTHSAPINVAELLQPLVEEMPLTARLMRGLLYTLLPGTINVIELVSCDNHEDLCLKDESFAAVIRAEDTPSLLVLGDQTTETLYVVKSDVAQLPILDAIRSQLSDWREEHIDPRVVGPHMESTLLSIYIAEACFMHHLPITRVPDSRHLRLRFLGELIAPYESNLVLRQCGMPDNLALTQKVDVRVIPQSEILPQTSTIQLPELENFQMETLRQRMLEKPGEISRKRCLRILQCVNEIGSTNVLRSLRLALNKAPRDKEVQPTERPFVEKLFHIHLYLDNQDSQGHLLVARHRYIKYCYFETYQHAVDALHVKKRNSKQEKRKISARKRTESYQQGFCEGLPPTPHTNAIDSAFIVLDSAQKKKRARDMVKDEIARRLAKHYKADEKSIRQNITKYVREGKALHSILQGAICLNPGLLALFPGREAQPPSLHTDCFQLQLEAPEKRSLDKPIDIKDIDELTQIEADWFGKVLQARPELMGQVPSTVMELISSSLTACANLGERDPNDFNQRPFHFFTE